MHQSEQGECGVAEPAIAVIPIPHAAELLGKRRRGSGDNAAGWSVGQSFQRDEGALDRLRPRPDLGTTIAPFPPECLRALQRVERIDSSRRILKRGSVREDEGNRVTGLDRELTDCCEVFTEECGRGSQDQTLRTGNRIECPVIESVDPRHSRAVVEAHHKLVTKNHPPRPPSHDPHKVPGLCGRHEIDDCRTARLCFEFGFEDEGAGTVAPSHAERRALWSDEPSAVVGFPEQSCKARSRVETGPAQPIDRTVAPDQSGGFTVTDQSIVFDSQRHCLLDMLSLPQEGREVPGLDLNRSECCGASAR